MSKIRVLMVDWQAGALGRLLRDSFRTYGWAMISTTLSGRWQLTDIVDLIIVNGEYVAPDRLSDFMAPESGKPPVMVLTQAATPDVIAYLDQGADVCLAAPFSEDHIMAQARSLIRRSRLSEGRPRNGLPIVLDSDLRIDLDACIVFRDASQVRLTALERDLLTELTQNPGKVLPHAYLLGRVWGPEYSGATEYLHTYVNHLRHKIEPDPRRPKFILTIPRVGYRFSTG